ncbi:MAG TPA: ATP-binding protein [Abditibacteriaceae bacterium]|jgi:two-component system CheB/CheR fusion protein
MNLFRDLFSGAGFIPNAELGAWTPALIRLHNICDFLIGTAYLAIAFVLVKFVLPRRHELPISRLFWLFSVFIVACGITHLMDIVLFYLPVYRLASVIKFIAAVVSWGTVFALLRVVPIALRMHSSEAMEHEIDRRQHLETELRNAHDSLETQISERSRALERTGNQLRRSEDRFFVLTEAMPEIMWTARPDGFLDYFNQRWVEYTGMTIEQTRGWSWKSVVHPDDLRSCLAIWQHSVATGEIYQVEHRLKRMSDQTFRWHLARALPLRDENGQITQWVGTCTDIEDQKKAQKELKDSHAQLEQRVQERTAELTKAGEVQTRLMTELERSNAELQNFASVASHDLQEPLRAIQTFSDRLKTKHNAALNDEGKDYLERIHKAANRMRTLVQDLLALSRVTTKARPFVAVDLNSLISAIRADLSSRLQDTQGHIECGELPTLQADATQMRQLLQNLIDNGLKFHAPGKQPIITISSHNISDEFCEIVVEDNGIGFDEKYYARIFEPFERLHGERQYSGTGIGLAICRKIVERHQGELGVQSVSGVGTKFVITLPLRQKEKE